VPIHYDNFQNLFTSDAQETKYKHKTFPLKFRMSQQLNRWLCLRKLRMQNWYRLPLSAIQRTCNQLKCNHGVSVYFWSLTLQPA